MESGGTQCGEYWHRRPDIVSLIRCRRIRWLGHVRRREDDSDIKRVWRGQPEGSRPARKTKNEME